MRKYLDLGVRGKEAETCPSRNWPGLSWAYSTLEYKISRANGRTWVAVTLMTLNFAISVSRLAQRRPGCAGRVLWSIGFQITTGSQLHGVG